MWAPTSAKDTTEKPKLPVLMRLLCNRAARHAMLAHAASSCHLPLQGASAQLAQRTDSLHTTPWEGGGGVRVGTLGAAVSTDRDGERVRRGRAGGQVEDGRVARHRASLARLRHARVNRERSGRRRGRALRCVLSLRWRGSSTPAPPSPHPPTQRWRRDDGIIARCRCSRLLPHFLLGPPASSRSVTATPLA